MNKEDFELTGEFKVSICPPTNLFFIGHDVLDFIARSHDGIHWEGLERPRNCVLCEAGSNFKFNEVLLKIVEKCNIPLEIYKDSDNGNSNICIRYSKANGSSDLIGQFNKVNQTN